MIKRFEVTYYEYGLTNTITRQFYTEFAALICHLWARAKYGHDAYVRTRQLY